MRRWLTGSVTALLPATWREEDGIHVVEAPPGGPGGGLRLLLEETCRDWRGMEALVFELEAETPGRIQVEITHRDGRWVWYLLPKPGLRHRVVVRFDHLRQRPPNTCYPGYFTFGGGPEPVNLAEVRSLAFRYDQPGPATCLRLGGLRLEENPAPPAVLTPRVVVDRFGQWVGKGGEPRSEAEIRAAWAAEPRQAGPFPGQSRLGGDARRRLAATGYFRIDRDEGRWTLVDPEGYRFFSVGPTCVRPSMAGPVGGREELFEALPPLEVVERGYWRGRFADFYRWNLQRRYGPDLFPHWAAQAEARLRQWGCNTIGNWSDEGLCRRGQIPYTDRVKGLDPLCQEVPDVFAPDFPQRVREAVEAELRSRVGDPLLIGYFVGNEPKWMFGGAEKPFQTLFRSVHHPHTKAEALAWLQQRYDSIQRVNAAWGTAYRTWAHLAEEGVPDPRTGSEALKADADAFTGHLLSRFYQVCCEVIRSIDPHHLLLGARFYTVALPDSYIQACRCFDVFSFNCYRPEPPAEQVSRVEQLAGLPSLIGEFHFGVVGRGRSGALLTVLSDAERGEAYRRFVLSAAAHPALVGAHWFQWVDEPVTGRFDGEDYNCGLVDIQDIPYEAMVAAVRETHAKMYQVRFGS